MTVPPEIWHARLRPVLLEMACGTPPDDALIFLPLIGLDEAETDAEARCLVRATNPAMYFLKRAAPDLTPSELADALAEVLDDPDDELRAMLEDLLNDLSAPGTSNGGFRSLRSDSRAVLAGLGNLLLASARYLAPAMGFPPEVILDGFFAFAENRLSNE